MDRNNHRFFLLMAACSVTGIALGGISGREEFHRCQSASIPSEECLMQEPTAKIVEGMSAGLIAGTGAAIAISWRLDSSKSS